MEVQEWLGKLKWLSNEQLIKTHFGLQEKIKKTYKLRNEGNNLNKSIALCEQQVAMAPLVMKAMQEKHEDSMREAVSLGMARNEFYAPSHHGYRQLCIILKKLKQLEKVAELEAKRDAEGWSK